MTWIKPSFLWMMCRAGWGHKAAGQLQILSIDITHEGFEWAMAHARPSHRDPGMSHDDWRHPKDRSPVRIQWDPERDLHNAPLSYRAIQIGPTGGAVRLYDSDWNKRITDVTPIAHDISADVNAVPITEATQKIPQEAPDIQP